MHKFKGGVVEINKMQKYPSIPKFLQARYPDVYDLIQSLAMEGALVPKRQVGLTFLLPNKKYVEKITKTLEGSKPEEASDMMLSLIIPEFLGSASAWDAHKDDIPNLLGKKITISKISGNTITIDNGTVTINPKFIGFDSFGERPRNNLAVWDLDGEVEYKKAQPALFKYLKKNIGKSNKAPTKGAGEDTSKMGQFVKKIIREEIECIKEGKKEDGNFVSPMLNSVARIIRGLNDKQLLLAARCLLTKCPIIDFFIFTKNPEIFPLDIIYAAYEDGGPDENRNVDTIKNLFKQHFDTECAIVTNYNKLENLRSEIVSSCSNSGLKINKTIIDIYSKMDNDNCISYARNNIDNVYPEYLANYFKSRKGAHLALDECKQFLHVAIEKVKKGIPSNDDEWFSKRKERATEYLALFTDFCDCYSDMSKPGKSMFSDSPFDGNDTVYAKSFCECMFLHFPSNNDFQKLEDRVKYGGNDDDYEDNNNIELEYEMELDNYNNSDLRLSECTLKELKAYVKANNGRLPDI